MIKAAGLLGTASSFYTPEAAQRGTLVHQACAAFDEGLEVAADEEILLYVQSYARFIDLIRPEWKSIEHPRYSEQYDFAGTADRVGTTDGGRPAVIDIKTGGPASWHGVQLALYDLLHDELPHMIRRRTVVHLRKDGGLPKMNEYSSMEDYTTAFRLIETQERHGNDDIQP